ncbi:tetratricopeptide repeat protein [Lacinutrix chionoecetis]
MKHFYYLIILFFGLQTTANAFKQEINTQQIDSVLSASMVRVYENPDESIAIGQKVFEDSSYTLKTRTKALMLLSLAHTSKRNYQKALEYILKADELSKNLDDKVLQTEILFRIGILYQQLRIFDKSIEYLEKTEQAALVYPIRNSVGKYLANSYTVKGFIYKDNLNCDIALEFFDKGIAEYLKLKNIEVNTNLSIAYYNKGNCYIQLLEYEKAKNSFNKSLSHAKLEKANSLIAFAKKGLAAVYKEEEKHQQAINLLETALKQSEKVGDLVLNSSLYVELFENHLALNQWEDYQKYYNLYSITELKIKTSERYSIDDSLADNTNNVDKEIRHIEKQFNNRLKWFFIVIIIIVLVVFFIERKNKKTIKSLKNEIKIIQNQKPNP